MVYPTTAGAQGRWNLRDVYRSRLGGDWPVVPPPAWLPLADGIMPFDFAAFSANQYWAGGGQVADFNTWAGALGVSFARPGPAYFTTSNGLIQSAANGVLRFDYDPVTLSALGVRLEGARTNFLKWSDDFTNTVWSKISSGAGSIAPIVTANAGTAPDGTATAQRLQATRGGTVGSYSLLTQTVNVTTGSPISSGFWIKSNTGANQNILCYDAANGYGAVFVATATWQRIALPSHTTGVQAAPAIGTTAGSGQYFQGGDPSIDVLLWNVQITLEAAPSSDIVTGATTTTRVADALTRTRANPAVIAKLLSGISPQGVGTEQVLWQLDDGTSNNAIRVTYTSAGQMHLIVTSGGITQTDLNLGALAVKTAFKVAIRAGATDFAGSLKGAAAVTQTSGAMPTGLVNERYGASLTPGNEWFSTIASAGEWATASNAALQSIST